MIAFGLVLNCVEFLVLTFPQSSVFIVLNDKSWVSIVTCIGSSEVLVSLFADIFLLFVHSFLIELFIEVESKLQEFIHRDLLQL